MSTYFSSSTHSSSPNALSTAWTRSRCDSVTPGVVLQTLIP